MPQYFKTKDIHSFHFFAYHKQSLSWINRVAHTSSNEHRFSLYFMVFFLCEREIYMLLSQKYLRFYYERKFADEV